MQNELEQLRVAYEELAMSPEQIANDRELDLAAVKAGLMQASSKYRKACFGDSPAADVLNFSDDDLAAVNRVIKDIALGAEDDHLRFKAATYIRDDKKGRRDVVNGVKNMGFNVLQFNQFMQQARVAADSVMKQIQDVEVVNS